MSVSRPLHADRPRRASVKPSRNGDIIPEICLQPDTDPLKMFQGLVDCSKYPNTNVARFDEAGRGQSCNNANCDFVNNVTVICNNTGPNDNADDITCNTLVDDESLNLVDDTSFVNDDTLDDDSLIDMFFVDSCSFGGDWDDEDEDSIFCEETLADLLPVEDDGTRSYNEVMFGVPQLALGQQEGDSGNAKVKGLLGVLFMFLLARVCYQAWVLAQLHASVHNWTTDDVELWLKDVVGLPQYLPIFRKFKVDGNILPRLALNTDHLIQGRFGISDTNHKNKIILKAMDLVLFGPPKVFYNPIKDALLALAILVAISGLFFSAVQRRKAQNQIGKMIEEVDKLQVNEQKFIDIQTELHEAEKKNETVVKEKQSLEKKLKIEINQAKNEAERLSKERELTKTEVERLRLAEEELEQVRLALFNAEAKQCQNSSVNRELQSYLKTTYRKEREQYNFKKAAADKQLEEAKQWGLKMKKKRAGVVSSLKMIHGNALEAVENRICSARTALIEATSDLQELSSRWRRIESLCNFNITASDDAEFGSTISLAGSDSNSSPEPSTYAGSIPRIASSNAVKDLAKMKNRVNGHKDSTDSDDSSHIEKRRKGKNLWRLVRESRLNSDQKWQDLLHQADQI
ncbi:stromal interaction molecule 1-like isoform X2 [Bolinopsis microptera]|uniref:stromal interaction molecule 1-like isoform X2 n=1 Tax=Bolinopsis microptera TaxID=2820187 RepID=UPI00307975D3